LFAYDPADGTAIPNPRHSLPILNPDCFYLFFTGYPGCPGKNAVKRVVVVQLVLELCSIDKISTDTAHRAVHLQ